MKDKSTLITILIAIAIVIATIGVVIYVSKKNSDPDRGAHLIPFAQCLKDAGAKFYGAYWCPHCREQKVLFGKAAAYLPYEECSNPAGNEQTEVCRVNNIERYPTWVFANGERIEGKLTLEMLSEKTSCPVPEAGDVTEESVQIGTTSGTSEAQ